MCIEADKIRPSIPSLAVQLSEATKPIPIPGKENHLLSPTSPEEPLYDIPSDDGDLSPSPRTRAHGFSLSPGRRRRDQPFYQPWKDTCLLPKEPQCDLYESIDSPAVEENPRAVAFSFPTDSQNQEQRQVDH